MKRLSILFLVVLSLNLSAQDRAEDNGPETIRSSFNDMLNQSNRYQDFKVIKRSKLDAFIIEVQDSLDVLQKRFQSEVKANSELQNEVSKLNASILAGNNKVQELEEQRDSITTLGMEVNKSAFSTVMWIIVLGLLGLLISVFLRNKSMAMTQKSVRTNMSNLEDELASTKKKALEREQELKREIQDYINKLEAMGPPR